MAFMRFVVAPDWFMKLPNETLLNSKHLIELYGYTNTGEGASQISHLIKRGGIPVPDTTIPMPRRPRLRWSVGYLKNYPKLPTELIEVKKDSFHTPASEEAKQIYQSIANNYFDACNKTKD